MDPTANMKYRLHWPPDSSQVLLINKHLIRDVEQGAASKNWHTVEDPTPPGEVPRKEGTKLPSRDPTDFMDLTGCSWGRPGHEQNDSNRVIWVTE